jgi:hypothetical protein
MRKADYLTLARTIRAYAIGEHRAHLEDMARNLAQSLSVERGAFLEACGMAELSPAESAALRAYYARRRAEVPRILPDTDNPAEMLKNVGTVGLREAMRR